MAERRIDAWNVRARVIEQLATLPPDEHLAALHAIDAGDIVLDLTDPDTVRVDLAGRWSFQVKVTRDR